MNKSRYFLLLIIATLFSTINIQAQTLKGKVATKGPSMRFESTSLNIGSIEQKASSSRYFEFINDGTEPLVISGAKSTSDFNVSYPQKPIAPGQKGKIEVKLNIKTTGDINRKIILKTNAVNGATTEKVGTFILQLKGTVK